MGLDDRSSASQHELLLPGYAVVVALAGAAAFVVAAANDSSSLLPPTGQLWVLLALTVIAEVFPLKIIRGVGADTLSTGIAYVFAGLLVMGLAPSLLLAVFASAASLALNINSGFAAALALCRSGLALCAADLVLRGLGYDRASDGIHRVSSADLPAIGCAAVVLCVVSHLLGALPAALRRGTGPRTGLPRDLAYRLASSFVLLALAPVVAAVSGVSSLFTCFLAIPIIAVHLTGPLSVEKQRASRHDSLTGLPDRDLLHDRATGALVDAVRHSRAAAVFLIDLDRFKDVNDTLGYVAGDQLLRRVGERLSRAVRPGDTVARLGGDEFAILLPDISSAAVADEIADRIRRSLGEPLAVAGVTFDLQGSIGIALCPEHGTDIDVLMRHADVAMYVAKETGARWERYSIDRDRNSPERLHFLGELRSAVCADELVVHYQPKAEVRTGKIVGAEALVRWEHPLRGLVLPDAFIPMAEQSGLIEQITETVLDAALRQAAIWRQNGMDLEIAVNVSVRNLHDVDFPDQVARALATHGISPGHLALEITESVVMTDAQRVIRTLEALHELGVRLSLDDFGAGYSSLTYLKRLPVSEIKIDKSFVLRMDVDDDDARIVRSTIDLAQGMGISVVAEGVENLQTWNRLVRLGCDVAQGYYLSPALAAEDFLAFSAIHASKVTSRAAG